MEYRILGKTGLEVSTIGIGGWPLGGLIGGPVGDPRNPVVDEGWTGAVDEESIKMIHQAEELGVNLVDTAEIYGDGHSESIIGLATKNRRDRWVISTKVRGFYTDTPDVQHTRDRIVQACEGGLRRLQTDYIDIFLLHNSPHQDTLPAAMETMQRLKNEGKIRWLGISHTAAKNSESIRNLMDMGEVSVMVIGHNMMSRNEERLKFARDENIGTLIASPLNSGILSGRWFENLTTLDPSDRRYKKLASPEGQAALRKLSELRFLTENGTRTMTQAALRFILDTKGVTSVIPGALRPSEIEENVGATKIPSLTKRDRSKAIEICDQANMLWQS